MVTIMLKLTNFKITDNHLYMDVLVEDEDIKYRLCVDKSDAIFPVVSSSIPSEYKIYERQARIALRRYIGKALPESISSSWC